MSVSERDGVLRFRLGEPFGPMTLFITNPDGSPTNLTGATLTLVLREVDGEADIIEVPMPVAESPEAGRATLAVPVEGDNGVNQLTAGVVYRYKVRAAGGEVLISDTALVRAEWG